LICNGKRPSAALVGNAVRVEQFVVTGDHDVDSESTPVDVPAAEARQFLCHGTGVTSQQLTLPANAADGATAIEIRRHRGHLFLSLSPADFHPVIAVSV
jgi:hypothetical protein